MAINPLTAQNVHEIACPHCEQASDKKAWPFCSSCGLFVIDIEQLDLSPQAVISVWRKEVIIGYLS